MFSIDKMTVGGIHPMSTSVIHTHVHVVHLLNQITFDTLGLCRKAPLLPLCSAQLLNLQPFDAEQTLTNRHQLS